MKNFNFFEKLWEHGRTLRRVGLVLVMCLITIGQMWGYTIWSATIFYDDKESGWNSDVCVVFEKNAGTVDDGASGGGTSIAMGHIENTKVWLWQGEWGNSAVSYYRFAKITGDKYAWYKWWKKSEGEKVTNSWEWYQTDRWAGVSNGYGADINNATKKFVSTGSSAGAGLNVYDVSSYPGDMNYTQTVYFVTRDNGGAYSNMSSGKTPATISMSSYKFVSGTYDAVSAESPSNLSVGGTTYSKSFTAGHTATTTLTVSNVIPGYKFDGWYSAATGGELLESGTTYTYYPQAGTNVYARFTKLYAFVEGRFRVYNSARGSRTSVGGQGSWVTNSANIPMTYDNTNNRFELHTYSTPAELKAAFTGGSGDADPYFFIKTSTSSSSISTGTSDGPTEYWAANEGTSYQQLTGAGTSNKKGVSKTSHALTFVGNSTSADGYAILYCDGSYIWYELEQTLEYAAGTGSGSAPASKTYYNKGTNATAATNTFTAPSGYHFDHWRGSDGNNYAAGASVPMNSNITLTAIWALDYPSGYIYITDVMATPETKAGTTITASMSSANYNTSLCDAFMTNRAGYEEWAITTGSGNYKLTFSSALNLSSYIGGVDIDVWWGATGGNKKTYIKINGGSQQDLDEVSASEYRDKVRKATFHTDVTSLSSIQVLGPSSSGSGVVWFRIGIKETPTYALSYNKNTDVTVSNMPTSPVNKPAGTITLDSKVPTRSGYVFLGWTEDEENEGTVYAAGDSYTMPSTAQTLYAKWVQGYTLTYDAGDGSAAPSDVLIPAGSYTLSSTEPTYAGHVFQGWEVDGGDGTLYAAGASFTMPSNDVTLVAQWEEICFQGTVTKSDGNYSIDGGGGLKVFTSDVTITSGGIARALNTTTGDSPSRTLSFSANGASLGTSNGYIEFVLPSGSILTTGSIIRIQGYADDASGGLNLIDDSGNTLASQTNKGTINFTYTVTAGSAINGNDHIRLVRARGSGTNAVKTVTIIGCDEILCSAPTSPSITGTTTYTAGQTISLTASATGTDESTTYEWWLGDPTNGGTKKQNASTSGATFSKASCGVADEGTYYCVISNGADCSVTVSKAVTVKCTVAYNTNGGTGSAPTDGDSPYASSARVTVKEPGSISKAGNTFIGWNTAPDGSGTYYSPKAHFAITENTTLYAVWQEKSTALTPAGGTLFSIAMNNRAESGLGLAAGRAERVSWHGTVTKGEASFTNTHGSTDNNAAIYKGSPAQLGFYRDNAMLALYLDYPLQQGDVISFTSLENEQLCFTTTTTRATTISTSAKSYTIPAESPLIGQSIVYAWRKSGDPKVTAFTITRPASNYTITLDNNDATYAGTENIAVTYNSTTNVTTGESPAITLPTKTGHNFGGYYNTDDFSDKQIINANGWFNYDVTDYTYDGAWIYDGSVTLYAKWTPKTYSITLEAGDGGTDGSATATYGATALSDIVLPTKAGYTLNEFYEGKGLPALKADGSYYADNVSDGNGYKYIEDGKWVADGDQTFTADWNVTVYHVTYAAGGATGNVPVNSTDYTGGETVTVSGNVGTPSPLSKAGYSFGGWSANVDLTIDAAVVTAGTTIAVGKTFPMPAVDVTLTAVWNINNYDLTWDLAGGTTTSAGTGITSGVSVNTTASVEYGATLSAPSVEKTGYTFSVWSPSVAATMPAANTTYTATWTANTYTITYVLYDSEEGSVSGKTSYQITDDDYDLPTPEWDGHTFLGWYATYSAGVYSNPVSVLTSGSTGDKTYHAKWAASAPVKWTITKVSDKLYAGGGGYSVKAVVDDASWTGDASSLVLSASDGVTLGTPTTSTVSSKKQIVASFSIGCDVEGPITFSLYAPANGSYAAIEDEEEVELDACPSGGGSTTIVLFDGATAISKTSADGTSYKNGTTYTNAATGFTYQFVDFKTDLTNVSGYSNHGSYNNANRYGGNSTSYYVTMTIPTGYTGSMNIVYGSTDASRYFAFGTSKSAAANGSNGNKWNATTAAATTLYSATVDDLGAGTYYLLATGDKALIAYLSFTLSGGSSAIATSLSWSGDDASAATAGTVNKNDISPDFTLSATRSTNSIGAITYTSSNTSVATVDEAGKVHIINSGTTTITATLAACGCYGGDEISYSLVVENTCSDTPGTIVNNDGSAIAGNAISRGACEALTLRLTGHTGSDIQWMKDGADIDGATSATYSVPIGESGVYTAVVTGDCALEATNSITVTTAGSVNPTIFADEFTVKQGHWFGYRLMEINAGESVSVKTAPTGWVNLSDFKITTKNNIVSIEGNVSRSTGDKTLTLTITNECGVSTDKDFTIHEIAETAKPTVAWIATDSDNKGKVDKVKADESTNTGLYKELEKYYTMTPRNCYWTTNEAELVKEYSQYDLIILTDYPNSQTGPNGSTSRSKSYTNAIGLLIDHKPILTFEAYVAGCPNWGFASNPKNTEATQKDLTLLCNAGDIFDDPSGKFAAGEAITVTDATSGQALQGFPVASSPDFVFIGKITDDTKEYVACCERQRETAARMMVFGLNSNIMDNMTADGKAMVKGFADYLMKTDPAEIPDCSVIFTGDGADDSWYTTANWEANSLPDAYASVRIDAPCVVPEDADAAKAGRIKIHKGGAFTGSLTIEPKGRLIVEKTITRVENDEYTVHKPTQPSDLVIQSDATGNGVLVMGSYDGTNQATVAFYTKAHKDETYGWINQFIGTPFSPGNDIYQDYYGSYIYEFDPTKPEPKTADENDPRWINKKRGYHSVAFQGYNILRKDAAGTTLSLEGQLCASEPKTLNLYYNGSSNTENMFANSWMAPIDVASMSDAFTNCEKTIYIFNAGSKKQIADAGVGAANATSAGQYIVLPVESAPWTSPTVKVIPSMQAFSVFATGAGAKLNLDYATMVLEPAKSASQADLTAATRAPNRRMDDVNKPEIMRLQVTGDGGYGDLVYMLMRSDFTTEFENGYDGRKMMGDGAAPQMYAISDAGNMSINCVADADGTVIGFQPGEDTQYTFTFAYDGDEDMYLNDIKKNKSVQIREDRTYMFTADEGDEINRFIISATPFNSPEIATGVTDLDADAPKVQKIIYNDKLYIIRGGKVFSADGQLVK